MTAPGQVCPTCGRGRLIGDPTGFRWDHGNDCPIRAAEDATAAHDVELVSWRGAYRRPVTEAERQLVAACGVILDVDAVTSVTPVTATVLRRSWRGWDFERGRWGVIDLDPPPGPAAA